MSPAEVLVLFAASVLVVMFGALLFAVWMAGRYQAFREAAQLVAESVTYP